MVASCSESSIGCENVHRLALQERCGDGETNLPNSDKFTEIVKEMISKPLRSCWRSSMMGILDVFGTVGSALSTELGGLDWILDTEAP